MCREGVGEWSGGLLFFIECLIELVGLFLKYIIGLLNYANSFVKVKIKAKSKYF